MRITIEEARESYHIYRVETGRIDYQGPAWSGGLACRGCWNDINKGQDSIDTGFAPWHKECYEFVRDNGKA